MTGENGARVRPVLRVNRLAVVVKVERQRPRRVRDAALGNDHPGEPAVAMVSGRKRRFSTPVAEWIGVGSSVWVIALGLLGTQLPLRLPDGRLPSPRWTWFSRISLALIAVTLIGMAAQQGRVEDVPGTANPVGSAWVELLSGAIFLLILCFFVALAALVMRYRRADALDRAQLRWVALGGAASW